MQTNILCALSLASLLAALSLSGQSQSSSAPTKNAAGTGANQVQHINLPQVPGDIPPGPNVEVYQKNCLICHSSRYVAMQPRFPKTVWQAEVKKMIDAYGASISEADQPLILEYLVAVKGTETPSTATQPKK
jgi:hypothetical protein